ncbi:MAG: PEGA domain-containing protein [Calditrichia bacterium]|nr:PEGA domain-containing protein [Calditrichia bacterium]
MFLKYFSALFVFVFLLNSCGLKQPDESLLKLYFGSAFVNSNFKDAKIFVDYDSTGKVTPDSVHNLPIGKHVIHVFKDGYIPSPDSIVFISEYQKTFNANFALQQITNPGTIFIDSNPQGAKIWIDSSFAGKTTPAYVVVSAGLRRVSLKKSGFELYEDIINIAVNDTVLLDTNLVVMGAQVLIESFANSSCLPCTRTNTHLENFIASYNSNHFALIEYFTNWPNFFDPMYQHNPIGSSARFDTSFYDVLSVPAMFVNGSSVNALDYTSITNAVNTHLASANVDVSISLSKQITDSLRVNVELNEFNALPTGNWQLFIVVVEKQVFFAEPPGSNGLSNFSHVFRKFLTSNDGDVFSFANNKFTKTYTSPLSSEWDLSEIQIIGFIQDINTKVVLNSSHL